MVFPVKYEVSRFPVNCPFNRFRDVRVPLIYCPLLTIILLINAIQYMYMVISGILLSSVSKEGEPQNTPADGCSWQVNKSVLGSQRF